MNFTPNSRVLLLTGVPLRLNEEHQRLFTSKTEQTQYFLSKVKSGCDFTGLTYQRLENEYIIRIERNAETLFDVNYVMFQNTNFSSKWFYGFVTKIEYANPNVCFVHYVIDDFQTWFLDCTFKKTFIERQHVPRYQSNGQPYIHTVDEGLMYGDEYQVVNSGHQLIYGSTLFVLIASKSKLHLTQEGYTPFPSNLGGIPNGLYYYLVPFNATGENTNYTVEGISLSSFAEIYYHCTNDETLVGKVVSLTVVDYCPYVSSVDGSSITLVNGGGDTVVLDTDATLNDKSLILLNPDNVAGSYSDKFLNSRNNKYVNFPKYTESKLLMYPYSFTLLTDFKGNDFIIKLEQVKDEGLTIGIKGSISYQNKEAFYVYNYLGEANDGKNTTIRNGIINTSNASLPIVDDYTAAYLQGNQNSLMYQSFTGVANSLIQAVPSAQQSAIMGAVTGGMLGGALGATTSILGSGISIAQQIGGVVTKLKDINNHPDSVRSMGNNANFDNGNKFYGLYLIDYTVTNEYAEILSDYFNMYGYKVNVVDIPNLNNRKYWNYIKTIGANIEGSIPQDSLQNIIAMFDKGITLWHTNDVLNYSLNNSEV